MRKILNCIVLFSFTFHQLVWAIPLNWEPEFESASVLPYHDDAQGRRWLLVSKKTYNEREYDAPSWGDFGGKVEQGEQAIQTAVRELSEETAGQITTTEAELLNESFHQIDMKNSPFGGSIRRHTIFFKKMNEMFMPAIESGIEAGPTSNGGREVSQYQWILATDLAKLSEPAIFGNVLGKYIPDQLRVESIVANQKPEHFSIPFFVLLQQLAVKKFLIKGQHSQTFSQIAFTKSGFQDWRLVHSGTLTTDAQRERQLQIALGSPRILEGFSPLEIALEIDDKKRQILEFDPLESIQANAPSIELRLLHKPTGIANTYPLAPNSPNFWYVNSVDHDLAQLMHTDTLRAQVLKQLTQALPQLQMPQLKSKQKPGTTDTKYSVEVKDLKTKNHPTNSASITWEKLPTMTDAQLRHLLGNQLDLNNTAAVLQAYKEKVRSMRSFSQQADTITHPSFVGAVEAVFAQERAHPELFTAYHGCTAEVHFLNTVYSVLSDMLGLPKPAVNWRLFDYASRRYPNVKAAFSDTAQSTIQEFGYLNPFEILVAANAALTGNPEHDGCRTLTYWKQSHSEVSLNLEHVLSDVFKGIGLNSMQALEIAGRLHQVFADQYYVEDPEALTQKRRVGILRQIFSHPEAIEEQIALSGWYFNNPLFFNDIQQPDGSAFSIYDGLEEGDSAWMKELPTALRFMTHIRAGDSIEMHKNIKRYNGLVPNGLRPFNLFDYEVRLFAGKDPALVKTHYYPADPADANRESNIVTATRATVENRLEGVELPIRSFYDFYTAHKLLQIIIKNQLNIQVSSPSVSLEQFKVAVAQGDREAMEVYLQDPSTHAVRFNETDIITGEEREFNLLDYMAMVGMRHTMAIDSIYASAITRKEGLFANITSFTESPYAIYALLREGLSSLMLLGWDGSLTTQLRFAFFNPRSQEANNKNKLSGSFIEMSIAGLIERTDERKWIKFRESVGASTNYAQLPDAFWQELVSGNHLHNFLRSGLINDMKLDKWGAIVAGLSRAGISEEQLYKDYGESILTIFHPDKVKNQNICFLKLVSQDTCEHILRKLVGISGSQAVLDTLKNFGKPESEYYSFSTHNYHLGTTLSLFQELGLIDFSWLGLSIIFYSLEPLAACEILKMAKNLGQAVPSYLFSSVWVNLSPEDAQQYVDDPEWAGDLFATFRYTNPMQYSTLSANEKKALYKQLYSLAFKKGALTDLSPDAIKPDIMQEWFGELSEEAKQAILASPMFNANATQTFGFPSQYIDDQAIEALRESLFPSTQAGIDFILKEVQKPIENTEWLSKLLQPFILPTFNVILEDIRQNSYNNKLVTPLALALFANAADIAPVTEGHDSISKALYSESALLLSAQEIANAIHSNLWNFKSSKFIYPKIIDFEPLLKARFAAVQDEVKTYVAADQENIRNFLNDSGAQYMRASVKAFLEYLIA